MGRTSRWKSTAPERRAAELTKEKIRQIDMSGVDFTGSGLLRFRITGGSAACSYERQESAFGYKKTKREARWVVYELPTGREVGVARHPTETVSNGVAAVTSGASGQLRFSPDGQHLYTTTTDTRRWVIL